MHVLLLNQAFHPDVVATAQMGKDLADALVRRGHKVTAVASRSIYGRSGAVLASSESIPVEGSKGVIEARRVGFSLFGKASIAARVADFALFYLLAMFRVLALPRADVVICYTTPPFIALAGLVSRWLRGSKAVYWVMDLYPDLPVACGVMKPRSPATRFFERVNRLLLRRSDVSVVLGRCMRDRVLAKGTPEDRVTLVPVWSDLAAGEPTPREHNTFVRQWNADDRFLVMYSGNLGLGHDAATICEAMRMLKDRDDIRFVFVGGGKRRAEVESFIRENALANASWHDYVPREQLRDSLSAADLHLISLKEGVEGIMVPSKLFGIMAVARPAVFVGHPDSEIARVLAESGGGVTVRETDAVALAKAITDFAGDRPRAAAMGRAALAHLAGRYDRDTACSAWIDLLERLTGGIVAGEPASSPGTYRPISQR